MVNIPTNRIITLVPSRGLIHAIMGIIANNVPVCLGRENGDGICLGMFTLTMTNADTCPQLHTHQDKNKFQK